MMSPLPSLGGAVAKRSSWDVSDAVREEEGAAFMGLMAQHKAVEGRGA